MARGTFKCAGCGENVGFNVGKNRRGTDRYAAWLESQCRLCSDCEEKERRAANAQAAADNAAAGLPALTGTDKQIAWAEMVRAQKLENLTKARSGELEGYYFEAFYGSLCSVYSAERALSIDDPNFNYAVSLLKNQTIASWWIDNRETKVGFLIKELFVKNPPPVEEPEVIKEAREEVLAQATVRPEFPLTETVAEIRVHEKSVEIVFPEKREDFWQIVKKQLGYNWSGNAWQRSMGIRTGAPADRAAEAGNRLLAAGFIVRIFDPAIQMAAIEGTYERECRRWVMKRTSGAYAGWFCIEWPERNERIYNATRKLTGSKYDNKAVVVPPEQFAEVLDFAQMYEFRLSPGAREAMEQARELRDAQLVAKPVAPEPHHLPQPGDKPPKLAVPETVEVSDEFKD